MCRNGILRSKHVAVSIQEVSDLLQSDLTVQETPVSQDVLKHAGTRATSLEPGPPPSPLGKLSDSALGTRVLGMGVGWYKSQ